MRLLKHSGVITLALAAVVLFFLAALLSNWFRYGLSLEAGVVMMMTTAVFAFVVIPSASLAIWKRNSKALLLLAPVSLVVMCFAATYFHSSILGGWFSPSSSHHVSTNGFQTLETAEGDLEYQLELVDPFGTSHKELLVIRQSGSEKRLPIELFEKARGGFAAANSPEDWCTLLKTSRSGEYVLHVTYFLEKAEFVIDLNNDTTYRLHD